ncbi:MAG: hypothetical protein J6R04_03675 [Clostridia bacterium]|nr:hypothetical protein [Clostridia bacterium]
MAINDIWKKFVREDETAEDTDDGANYYVPRKKAEPASLIDEPDDDLFTVPAKTASRPAARAADDYDDLGEDDPDEPAGKPRFKRVAATGIKSAEHAVDLICRKYVVLINTSSVPKEALVNVQCYLAGAIRALDAHITPLDESNYFVSIESFDASPYLPHEEQDVLDEQEGDLI